MASTRSPLHPCRALRQVGEGRERLVDARSRRHPGAETAPELVATLGIGTDAAPALVRAADNARRQDPQLARIYHLQMTERGKNHLAASCVVAAHLAERSWLVMRRGAPYVLRDIDGSAITPAQAKAIIAERYTVTDDVRLRRRSNKGGKAPQKVLTEHSKSHAKGVDKTRRPSPTTTSARSDTGVKQPA